MTRNDNNTSFLRSKRKLNGSVPHFLVRLSKSLFMCTKSSKSLWKLNCVTIEEMGLFVMLTVARKPKPEAGLTASQSEKEK